MTSFPKYDRDAFVAVQFVISPLLEKKMSLEQALSKERAWDLAEKLLWIADEIGESFVCGRQKFFSSLAPKPEPLDGQSRARREPPDERLVELERTFSLGVYELVKADGSLSDRLSSAWNNHIRNFPTKSVPAYFSRSLENLHDQFNHLNMADEAVQLLVYDIVLLRELIREAATVDHYRWSIGL